MGKIGNEMRAQTLKVWIEWLRNGGAKKAHKEGMEMSQRWERKNKKR